MKKDIHPKDYRPVVFEDLNNGVKFLTRSTVKTSDTIKLDDGKEYPLVKVHISSSSHPFFTGQEKLVDIEGRVDRFKARLQAADTARAKKVAASTKKKPQKPAKDEISQEPAEVDVAKPVEAKAKVTPESAIEDDTEATKVESEKKDEPSKSEAEV